MTQLQPTPVILDTDIGGDIDDTWALALLLRCPELVPRLIVSDSGDTTYRARIIAKLLDVAGRTDIPVGIGLPFPSDGARERQRAWVEDYDLDRYPGTLHRDGVQAMIEIIMQSPEPVTLIAIGPVPNIAAALQREPRIAPKTRLVAMAGSFRLHHTTNLNNRELRDGPIAEFNVKRALAAAQAMFAAPWLRMTITPLDTCGFIVLDGERYARLRHSSDPLMQAVLQNYRLWSPNNEHSNPETHTSVLYDTVAVYLAMTYRHLDMKPMRVRVDDRGFTVESPDARTIDVAWSWEDLNAFYDFLTTRYLKESA